jgi:hypothetical protein
LNDYNWSQNEKAIRMSSSWAQVALKHMRKRSHANELKNSSQIIDRNPKY